MEVRMLQCNVIKPNEPWWERMDVNMHGSDGVTKEEIAEMFCKEIIKRFNKTLRPGELKRKFLKVEILDDTLITKHEWRKKGLVSQYDSKGQLCDTYECKNCGVTAKRYGLAGVIVQDPKYRKDIYKDCKWKTASKEKKSEPAKMIRTRYGK